MKRIVRSFLPFLLITFAISGSPLSRFIAYVSAQNGRLPTTTETSRSSAAATGSSSGAIVYPPTKKVDVVDDYFGTKVPDP
jgi:hypothetical protein